MTKFSITAGSDSSAFMEVLKFTGDSEGRQKTPLFLSATLVPRK